MSKSVDCLAGECWNGDIMYANLDEGTYPKVHSFASGVEFKKYIQSKTGNLNARVEEVWSLSHRLLWFQPLEGNTYHQWIVFKADSAYWSIEKTPEGILVQRSLSFDSISEIVVKDGKEDNRQVLFGPTVRDHAVGITNVNKLIEWIQRSGQMEKEYNILLSNCQDFAEAVFHVLTGQ